MGGRAEEVVEVRDGVGDVGRVEEVVLGVVVVRGFGVEVVEAGVVGAEDVVEDVVPVLGRAELPLPVGVAGVRSGEPQPDHSTAATSPVATSTARDLAGDDLMTHRGRRVGRGRRGQGPARTRGCQNAAQPRGPQWRHRDMTTLAGPIPAVSCRGVDAVPAHESVDVESALRELYEIHYARLAGWTTKLVGDPDIAHDLASEAFVKLYRDFARVDEPRPWLYTVTANLVRDHWRKRGREAAAYQRHEAGRDPVTHAPDHATTLTVRDAVQALPDRLRVVVLLHYFADLPVATVARQLEKSEGTVKRDLFDARRRMAQTLGETR
ncbi:RNA polymerase sigma factor [Phycicoccus ginsengisoli]